MITYYLRIEAVNLDYSIYDTYNISTIRGGSFLIHRAFEEMKKKLQDKNSLPTDFADLGSTASVGLYSFKSNNPDTVLKQILEVAKDGIESFTTLVWALHPSDGSKDFTVILNELMAECRWKQYQSASLILPQEKNMKRSCELDGVRPAAVAVTIGNNVKEISTAVNARRKAGIQLRNEIYKALLGNHAPAISSDPEEWIVTNDLEQLALRPEAGKTNGKIAFLYLDGNRFGTIRNELCTTEALYIEFQEMVQKYLRNSALKALLEFALHPDNESFLTNSTNPANRKIRLETLLWGGDEIEWVVPAWQALNALSEFYRVTQLVSEFQGVKLTHAAGVVFCHHDLPILQIRRYAHELCSIAKETISVEEVVNLSTDADRFAILNIISFDYMKGSVRDFLIDYYRPAQLKDFVFTANEIPLLIKQLPQLKRNFPSRKLHELLQAIHQQNTNKINETFERVKKLTTANQWNEIQNAIAALNLSDDFNRWFAIADLMKYIEA